MVREGADELTLRREEGKVRTFIDTTNVCDNGWVLPLVDEDWHAVCQAIHKDVEEQREVVYHKYVEMHKAINLKKSSGSKKAIALWSMRDAKANGEAYYDRGGEHVENSSAVRQALWEAHVKSPTAALEEALRRTENGGSTGAIFRCRSEA